MHASALHFSYNFTFGMAKQGKKGDGAVCETGREDGEGKIEKGRWEGDGGWRRSS